MNESVIEKIRTLNGKFTSGNSCPVTRVTITDTEYKEIVDFIVRECMIISRKVDLNPYIPDGDQAKKIIREIKQHFGVEE
jgi:hypothetical protein